MVRIAQNHVIENAINKLRELAIEDPDLIVIVAAYDNRDGSEFKKLCCQKLPAYRGKNFYLDAVCVWAMT